MGLIVPEHDSSLAGEETWPLLRFVRRALGMGAVVLARPGRRLQVAHADARMDGMVDAPPLFQVAAALRQRLTIDDLLDSPAYHATRIDGAAQPLRFFASAPLVSSAGAGLGALCVVDPQPRAGDAGLTRQMEEAARLLVPLLTAEAESASVAALRFDLAQAEGAARQHAAAARRYKKMYERASACGKIGVWEFDFRTRQLTWTDGVYDIFGVPRGTRITGEIAWTLYDHASRRDLERLREQAIATCGGFTLDARIRDLRGVLKWVRVSGEVEADDGQPVRIFGLKQDITAERSLRDQLRRHTECDAFTGLSSRVMLEQVLAEVREGCPRALLLVDLDGFKGVNDSFGRKVGDACLLEVATRLRRVFRGMDLIARIGSDAFAVLAQGPQAVAELEGRVHAAAEAISAPIAADGHVFSVAAAIGIGRTEGHGAADDLFAQADADLRAARNRGRKRPCGDGEASAEREIRRA